MTDAKKDDLDTFLKRYKLATEAVQKQAKREELDLEFQVPEKQWDEGAKRERLGFSVAGVPQPPRPCLAISKLQQPIDMLLNQERAAHLGVNVHPISEASNEDDAEIRQSLYRRIERSHPPANIARSWAYARAVQVGRGWYRIGTVYDDTADPEDEAAAFDQNIVIQRILYQNLVYMDPSSVEPDYSDAEYAFVCAWVPVDEFKRQWPKADVLNTDGSLTLSDGQKYTPEWTLGDGEEQAILVAEHWYKEHEFEEIQHPQDKSIKRKRDKVTLKYCKMTGVEILEKQDWNGKHIPLVPVIGRELIPFDAERRWTGIIGPAKDGQKVYNYAISGLVEKAALEPRAPWILDPLQIEGYEAQWQQSNSRNMPFLPYHSRVQGMADQLPPPARVQVSQEGMGPLMMLVQESGEWVQTSTALFDPSLGKNDPRRQSGKAITALQGQGEQSNSNFLYNLADISMTREAEIVLDMMPYIYDRPGRIVQILDAEDTSEAVMLNQPYYEHPKLGPTPAPMGPGGQAPTSVPVPGGMAPVKHFDLSKGNYNASVSIGKSYQSRTQEGQARIGEMIQAMPNLAPLILPLLLKFDDFPGSREMADILMKARDAQFPFLAKSDGAPPDPEQAQAQIQQLQQQLQQAHQQLQQAGQMIHTKQVEQQGKLQIEQVRQQGETQRQGTQIQSDQLIAKMNDMMQLLKSMHNDKHEAIQGVSDQLHDGAMAQLQQAHEQSMPAVQAAAAPVVPPFNGSASEPIGGDEPL